MFIYILIFLLLSFLAYQNDFRHQNQNFNKQYNWTLIILILFAGLRNRVGSDSIGYESNFENIQYLFNNINSLKDIFLISQPFWNTTMYLVKIATESFVVFQLLHAAVLNVLLFRFVKKVTPYCFTAVTLFFVISWWNLSFEVLRESICVALFLNASLELNDKKYKNYLIFAIIATFYHWFAFVPFIIQPLVMFANKRLVYVLFVCIFILVLVFLDSETINLFLTYISGDNSSEAAKRMMSYTMDYSRYGFVNINLIGLAKLLLLDILFPLIIVRYNDSSKYAKLLGTMCLLYIFFCIMATKIVISGRFCNYYVLPLCVASSIVIFNKRRYIVGKFINLLLLLNILFAIRTFYMPDNPNLMISYDCRYIPYTSIFQEPDPVRERYYGQ